MSNEGNEGNEENKLLASLSDLAGDVYLTISPDNLTLRMMVTSGASKRQLTVKVIERLLLAQNIKSDINYALIEKTLSLLTEPLTTVAGVVIAEGLPAVNGEDARFIPKFTPLEPKVSKGDELLTKVAPTQGTPGADIFGNIIVAKPGQAVELRMLDNVVSELPDICEEGSESQTVADCDGYAILINGAVSVSPIYALSISDDKYQAKISFDSPEVSAQELLSLMKKFDISHGIQNKEIKELIATGSAKNALIAQGAEVKEGQDGMIEYYFARKTNWRSFTDEQKVSVDNKNFLTMYDPDEKLLFFKPAVLGVNGKTIFGDKVPARAVERIRIAAGKNVNVEQDESGVTFFGKMRGTPVLQDNKLNVINEFVVQGDLDSSIGNIDFEGSVHIKGYVPKGYCIRSDKNITVDGVVYHASLSAKGDVTVKAGITGVGPRKSLCVGTLNAKYLNNASIRVGGNVSIANEIIDSHVYCRGKVECKSGALYGGEIMALKGVQVNVLGNSHHVKTFIVAGKDFQYQHLLKDCAAKKAVLDKEESKLNRALFEMRQHPERLSSITPVQKMLFKGQLMRLSVISNEKNDLENLLKNGKEKEKEESIEEVFVKESIYPGVYLEIDGSRLNVGNEHNGPLKALVIESVEKCKISGIEKSEKKLKLVTTQ